MGGEGEVKCMVTSVSPFLIQFYLSLAQFTAKIELSRIISLKGFNLKVKTYTDTYIMQYLKV